MAKPSFTRFIGFIFHITIIWKNPLFKCIFHHLYLLLKMRTQNKLLNDLMRPETQRELRLVYQLHVQ
jgi:hypothetical protein